MSAHARKNIRSTKSNDFRPSAFHVGISKENFGEKTFTLLSQNENRIEKA